MKLPQELIDGIVDHLADDIPTLKRCSLVSDAHHLSCRRYIFAEVHLLPLEERREPERTVANTCRLFHRLLSASPDIASLVQRLFISDCLAAPTPPTVTSKPIDSEPMNDIDVFKAPDPSAMTSETIQPIYDVDVAADDNVDADVAVDADLDVVADVNGQWGGGMLIGGGDYDGDLIRRLRFPRLFFTEWFVDEPTFSSVLSKLVNLQRLSFSGNGTRWSTIPSIQQDALRDVFERHTLTRVDISEFSITSEDDLLSMFGGSPSFTHLSFANNFDDVDDSDGSYETDGIDENDEHVETNKSDATDNFLKSDESDGSNELDESYVDHRTLHSETSLGEPTSETSSLAAPATSLTYLQVSKETTGVLVQHLQNPNSPLSVKRLETLSILANDTHEIPDLNWLLNEAAKTLDHLECGPDTLRESLCVGALLSSHPLLLLQP